MAQKTRSAALVDHFEPMRNTVADKGLRDFFDLLILVIRNQEEDIDSMKRRIDFLIDHGKKVAMQMDEFELRLTERGKG